MPRQLPAKVVARRLKQARLAVAGGMTQRALGMRLGLDEDVAATRVNRYERGAHAPDAQTLLDLARELDVPPGFLLTEDDRLAAAILGFAMLSRAKQDEILASISEALGPERAEEIRTRLKTPKPRKSPKARKRAAGKS